MGRILATVLLATAMVNVAWAAPLDGEFIATVPYRAGLPPVTAGQTAETAAGELAAVYLAREGVELAIYMESDSVVEVQPQEDARPHLRVQKGAIVVQYASSGPLILSTAVAWVRLEAGKGMIRAGLGDAGPTFTLANGRATRFDGAVPAGDVSAAGGGEALTVRPESKANIVKLLNRLVEARVLAEPDQWLKLAEAGDFVPSRQWASPALGIPPEYRVSTAVTQVVSAAAAVTAPPTVIPSAVTPTVTQAQTLLASQNPASVVVGARLERTRIVGNPGAAGGVSGVRFNTQARGPLQLGPRVR